MISALMAAIVSLNAYDRGIAPGLDITNNTTVGATIGLFSILTDRSDPAISFNGTVYQDLTDPANYVVAYRGTDDIVLDEFYGWGLGAGTLTTQTEAAALLYQQVANGQVTGQATAPAKITAVGHSLGGGLAGFVSSIYGSQSFTFDTMGYRNGAQYLFNNLTAYNQQHYFNGALPGHGILSPATTSYRTTGELLGNLILHEPSVPATSLDPGLNGWS